MNSHKIPDALPEWIPCNAQLAYASQNHGGRTQFQKDSLLKLFTSPLLEDFWNHLSGIQMDKMSWSLFLNHIISPLAFLNPGGTATRDKPDRKIKVRDNQKKADRVRKDAASTARKLANQMREILELSFDAPINAWSVTRLVRMVLYKREQQELLQRFDEFLDTRPWNGVVYDRNVFLPDLHPDFPSTPVLLDALADALDLFPHHETLFNGYPELASAKSSPLDFVRGLEFWLRRYRDQGIEINLRPKDWVKLIKVFFDRDIDHRHLKAINL